MEDVKQIQWDLISMSNYYIFSQRVENGAWHKHFFVLQMLWMTQFHVKYNPDILSVTRSQE